jgi:hypothetical protein
MNILQPIAIEISLGALLGAVGRVEAAFAGIPESWT